MSNVWQSQHLFLWVFNVGRGICAFVRTPENFGLSIDCGGDGENRPLRRVEKLILPSLTKYSGVSVAQAVVSHPHVDHYRDIYRMVGWHPHLITCPNDKTPIDGYPDERFSFRLLETKVSDEPLLRVYRECYSERSLPLRVPAFGRTVPNFHYGLFYVRPPVAERDLPTTDYVNNCSIMAFLRIGDSSVLLPGDIMTSGMDHAINTGCESRLTGSTGYELAREKTLDMKALRTWIKMFGCKFLVAPHHGLESAWPEAMFDSLTAEGHQVRLALISEKDNPGENGGRVDSRYYSGEYVKGQTVFYDNGSSEVRRAISTRKDGHMLVAMHQTAKPVVAVSHDLDWILTKAPLAIVESSFRRATVAA